MPKPLKIYEQSGVPACCGADVFKMVATKRNFTPTHLAHNVLDASDMDADEDENYNLIITNDPDVAAHPIFDSGWFWVHTNPNDTLTDRRVKPDEYVGYSKSLETHKDSRSIPGLMWLSSFPDEDTDYQVDDITSHLLTQDHGMVSALILNEEQMSDSHGTLAGLFQNGYKALVSWTNPNTDCELTLFAKPKDWDGKTFDYTNLALKGTKIPDDHKDYA